MSKIRGKKNNFFSQLKEHNVRLIGVGLETLGMEVEKVFFSLASLCSLQHAGSVPKSPV